MDFFLGVQLHFTIDHFFLVMFSGKYRIGLDNLLCGLCLIRF